MITKQINLSTWELNDIVIYANSGEVDSRYIEVIFRNSEQEIINLSNLYVTFYAKKPDGTSIFKNCTIDTTNNTATVKLTSQSLSVPGVVRCEFRIFDANDNLLKVRGMEIVVFPSEDFSQPIESTSEFDALTTALNQAREFSGNLSSLTTTAKNTLVAAINELNGKIVVPSVLYSNSSGTQSTVTLGDSASNYDYIEIYYHKDAGQIVSSKVYSPNGKSATLHSVSYYSGTIFARAAIVDINSNSITWRTSDSGWGTINNNGNNISNQNVFYIDYVIGYK